MYTRTEHKLLQFTITKFIIFLVNKRFRRVEINMNKLLELHVVPPMSSIRDVLFYTL